MTPFGPMVGAAAIPPASFGGGAPLDLTFALLALAGALAGFAALALVRRRRRAVEQTRIVVRSKAASLAA